MLLGTLIPLFLILFCCVVIWRACDGFEIASEYLGRNLSDGVRGGTINAISSSLPELFTTLIALLVLDNSEGFAVGIGTTAGSAIFNGMIIPAACILTAVGTVVLGVRVTSVNVSTKVLLRDGLSLIFCEFVLILAINGSYLHWWQGLLLVGLYVAYLTFILKTMKGAAEGDAQDAEQENVEEEAERGPVATVIYWLSFGPLLDLERMLVREHHRRQMEEERWNGWPLLIVSTAIMGATCWLLVRACEWLGSGPGNEMTYYTLFDQQLRGLGMPTMFVAVIFASMATSVPDTVMSIRDARDGDYDDAVANALGSNIFDICFALGFPLLLYTLFHGPIALSPDIRAESAELRLMLLLLTIVGFFIYFIGRRGRTEKNNQVYVEMKRGKALLLLTVYLLFVGYIIGRSEDAAWALAISDFLRGLLAHLPEVG